MSQDSHPERSKIKRDRDFSASIAEGVPGDTMLELLTQLALRKRLIALLTGIGLSIGLILCLVLPVHYTAATEIMPPKQTESTASLLNSQMAMGALAQAGAAAGLLADPNAIYMGLLKSRPIADALIQEFHLTSVYHSRDMTAARKRLASRTTILSEPSTLISVAVIDGDRRRAADLANAYIEQLRGLSKTISITEASKRRRFFEQQLTHQKELLIAAELAFQQIQQSKGLIHLDAQANVTIGSLALLHSQIAAKEVELQGIRSYSTERNPDVQLAESELSTMQAETSQLEQHGQSKEYSEFALKDVPKAGLDFIRAQRQLQYEQSLFDLLLRQYEAAKLDEAKEAAVIEVVAAAIQPDRDSSPKRVLLLSVGTFVGLFFGCLAALLLHRIELEQVDPEGALALHRLKDAFTR
jgi:tyrosine-protein kinase Etk/Wzc